MAVADALVEITRRWSELAQTLDEHDRDRLVRVLARAVHGEQWDPQEVLEIVMQGAPATDSVWAALDQRATRRSRSARPNLIASAAALRWVLETTRSPAAALADPEAVEAAAEAAVLEVPLVKMPGPEHPRGVLVLLVQGTHMAPSFQFDDMGRPIEAAQQINLLLEAEEDPWGVASWWLTPNAWLHAIPSDELRAGDPGRVLAAARAVGN